LEDYSKLLGDNEEVKRIAPKECVKAVVIVAKNIMEKEGEQLIEQAERMLTMEDQHILRLLVSDIATAVD